MNTTTPTAAGQAASVPSVQEVVATWQAKWPEAGIFPIRVDREPDGQGNTYHPAPKWQITKPGQQVRWRAGDNYAGLFLGRYLFAVDVDDTELAAAAWPWITAEQLAEWGGLIADTPSGGFHALFSHSPDTLKHGVLTRIRKSGDSGGIPGTDYLTGPAHIGLPGCWRPEQERPEGSRPKPAGLHTPRFKSSELPPRHPHPELIAALRKALRPAATTAAKSKAVAGAGHGGKRAGAGRPGQVYGDHIPGQAIRSTDDKHGIIKSVAIALRRSKRYGEHPRRSMNYLAEKLIPDLPADTKRDWPAECKALLDWAWKNIPGPNDKSGGYDAEAAAEVMRETTGELRETGGTLWLYDNETGAWTDQETKYLWTEAGNAARSWGGVNAAKTTDLLRHVVNSAPDLPDTGWSGLRNVDFHPNHGVKTDHDPSRYIRHRLPAAYNTKAESQILRPLLEGMLRPEEIQYLLQHVGRAVLGLPAWDEHPYITGETLTGKSTLLAGIAAVFGPHLITRFSIPQLATDNRFGRRGLPAARMNLSGEADSGNKRDGKLELRDINTLKLVLSNEPIPYEEKQKHIVTAPLNCGHIFAGNGSTPFDTGGRDEDAAVRRRLRLMPVRDDAPTYTPDQEAWQAACGQAEIDWLATAAVTAHLENGGRRSRPSNPAAIAQTLWGGRGQ